jgi:hypothetical protein
MNSKAALGLSAGALVVGLLGGLSLGGDDNKPAKPTGPGPTKAVAGVPVGYARSHAGAVAAAAAYVRSLNEATSLSVEKRRAVIEVITSTGARNDVQTRADEAYSIVDKAAPNDGSLFVRSGTLAFRVDIYDDSKATVAVWTVDVIGAGTAGGQAGWGTKTVSLKWEENDWKLAGFPTQQEGPTPTPQGQPTPGDAFAASIKDLEPLSHATD